MTTDVGRRLVGNALITRDFACGHVPLDDAATRLRVDYGADDSVIAAADMEVGAILDSLREPDPRFGHEQKQP